MKEKKLLNFEIQSLPKVLHDFGLRSPVAQPSRRRSLWSEAKKPDFVKPAWSIALVRVLPRLVRRSPCDVASKACCCSSHVWSYNPFSEYLACKCWARRRRSDWGLRQFPGSFASRCCWGCEIWRYPISWGVSRPERRWADIVEVASRQGLQAEESQAHKHNAGILSPFFSTSISTFLVVRYAMGGRGQDTRWAFLYVLVVLSFFCSHAILARNSRTRR